jgi:hypothetical protein
MNEEITVCRLTDIIDLLNRLGIGPGFSDVLLPGQTFQETGPKPKGLSELMNREIFGDVNICVSNYRWGLDFAFRDIFMVILDIACQNISIL